MAPKRTVLNELPACLTREQREALTGHRIELSGSDNSHLQTCAQLGAQADVFGILYRAAMFGVKVDDDVRGILAEDHEGDDMGFRLAMLREHRPVQAATSVDVKPKDAARWYVG